MLITHYLTLINFKVTFIKYLVVTLKRLVTDFDDLR